MYSSNLYISGGALNGEWEVVVDLAGRKGSSLCCVQPGNMKAGLICIFPPTCILKKFLSPSFSDNLLCILIGTLLANY
jgi:hypothetical protein